MPRSIIVWKLNGRQLPTIQSGSQSLTHSDWAKNIYNVPISLSGVIQHSYPKLSTHCLSAYRVLLIYSQPTYDGARKGPPPLWRVDDASMEQQLTICLYYDNSTSVLEVNRWKEKINKDGDKAFSGSKEKNWLLATAGNSIGDSKVINDRSTGQQQQCSIPGLDCLTETRLKNTQQA